MEHRGRAREDRFRVGTWGIRVVGQYAGTNAGGAWLGFGSGESKGKAQIILDEEAPQMRNNLLRFETEEAAVQFLVERVVVAPLWADAVKDLIPKQLDKNLW